MPSYTFEIQHPSLVRARIDMNKEIIDDQYVLNGEFSLNLKIHYKSTIDIWFWPWKITPYLRINNHLINYGIMGIKQYDHQLSFDIDKKWIHTYRDNLIQSRIDSQFRDKEFDRKLYESSIGYNVNHENLIAKIRKKIDE